MESRNGTLSSTLRKRDRLIERLAALLATAVATDGLHHARDARDLGHPVDDVAQAPRGPVVVRARAAPLGGRLEPRELGVPAHVGTVVEALHERFHVIACFVLVEQHGGFGVQMTSTFPGFAGSSR